jgi:hypothetical protein
MRFTRLSLDDNAVFSHKTCQTAVVHGSWNRGQAGNIYHYSRSDTSSSIKATLNVLYCSKWTGLGNATDSCKVNQVAQTPKGKDRRAIIVLTLVSSSLGAPYDDLHRIMPAHLLLDESLPRKCHARMKERATETAYDPDPICRRLRPDRVMASFRENTQRWTWTAKLCHRAACHQSIVLSYPQRLLVHVSLTIYCTFSSPQSIPAASISNANFGVFPVSSPLTSFINASQE